MAVIIASLPSLGWCFWVDRSQVYRMRRVRSGFRNIWDLSRRNWALVPGPRHPL